MVRVETEKQQNIATNANIEAEKSAKPKKVLKKKQLNSNMKLIKLRPF